MSDHLRDEASQRAAVAWHALESLVAAVENMRRSLGLSRDTAAMLDEIKKTMHAEVPPYGFTVLQAVCDRERHPAFNQCAASEFPTIRQEFDHGIQDFVVAREGNVPTRRIRKLARNAWKQDSGADRRIREMECQLPDQFRSPYRGQPELYDPEVVLAFEIAIARAIGRSYVSWTRGTNDNKSSGPILDVLVAAVQWAICIGWQCSAVPGSEPPKVKAEGLLGIVKAKRNKSTN